MMRDGTRMVKVDKTELLKTIKANRSKHAELCMVAQKAFREQAIQQLDKMLAEAKAGKPLTLHVPLVVPANFTKEYDNIIKMLEMSVDTQIEISESDFKAFVMDDWNWKRQWATSNSSYVGDSAIDPELVAGQDVG